MTRRSKKCVYQFRNGKKCDSNALDGSSYCSTHRPQESQSSSGGSSRNPFKTEKILYAKVGKGF